MVTRARTIIVPLQTPSGKRSRLHFRGTNLGHNLHFSISRVHQAQWVLYMVVRQVQPFNELIRCLGVLLPEGTEETDFNFLIKEHSMERRRGRSLEIFITQVLGVTHESDRAQNLARAPATRGASNGSVNTVEGTCADWFPESEKHLKGGRTGDRPQNISRCLYQMEEGLGGVEAGLENAVQEGRPLQGKKDLPSVGFHGEQRMKTLS